jgi:hypothetical protein
MSILQQYNVPLDKIIGVCADGASTMQGIYRGVCIRFARHLRQLRQEVCDVITAGDIARTPDTFHSNIGVFTIHCVCHRLALIVTDAMKKGTKACEPVIPEACLQCLTAIHEYFAKSTRRKKKLREYLENVNATIRENQKQTTAAARARATAGRRQPAVELEHINP